MLGSQGRAGHPRGPGRHVPTRQMARLPGSGKTVILVVQSLYLEFEGGGLTAGNECGRGA